MTARLADAQLGDARPEVVGRSRHRRGRRATAAAPPAERGGVFRVAAEQLACRSRDDVSRKDATAEPLGSN